MALPANAQSNYATAYSFTTLAGVARLGPAGGGSADGTGNAARFNGPSRVAVDSAGNVYVADSVNHTIRKITPAGVVTTLAGLAGTTGGADGVGSSARFGALGGIAVDSSGNVYVADSGNNTIREITPTGTVTTLAGQAGNAGVIDGAGTAALFRGPAGLAVDASGSIYVADDDNRIRTVSREGMVSTLAGGTSGTADGTGVSAQFCGVRGVAVDGAGNVVVADSGNHTIRKITPAGAVTTLAGSASISGSADGAGSAAQFYYPQDVSVDSAGNVIVADSDNNLIRKISPAGVVTTLAGPGDQITTDHGADYGSANGAGAAAQFKQPTGVAVDASGKIYVADCQNNLIRTITPVGVVTTLAGSPSSFGSVDSAGGAARFGGPAGAAVDASGNVYVADQCTHTIRKVTSGGIVTTLAGLTNVSGSADGLGSTARFNLPTGVAVDGAGNVFVADLGNDSIRRITAGGTVTTVAGLAGISGSADGTGSAARFSGPAGVAVDASGTIYVADAYNHTIRKITPAGSVTTLAGLAGSSGSANGAGSAARFMTPWSVALNASGNIIVADDGNNLIREITPGGAVTTLAGQTGVSGGADGTGAAAQFGSLAGVAVDAAGNAYAVGNAPDTIRRITPAGAVTTIAGGGPGGGDGAGPFAHFFSPGGIAVDAAGSLYVADFGNNTIRVGVLASAPAVTIQPLSLTVTVGGTASFTVAASGTPAPTLQWQVSADGGGTWANLAEDGVTYSGVNTSTLLVSSTTVATSGWQYRCLAANGAAPDGTSDAATLTVITADQAFLQQIFPAVLGRQIDAGALAAYLGVMSAGYTRSHVYIDLIGSAEYANRQIEPAIRLYFAALARMPDYAGLLNWSGALNTHFLTLTGAADQFAGSQEFLLKYGSLDNTGYVQQLYRNVLGREADPTGLADWVGQLDRGASRGAILVGFSESDEFKANMADQVEILRLFFLLDERMPTDAEMRTWMDFLKGGGQTDTLFAQGYPSGLANTDYVQAVFRGFLRRDADAGALGTFGEALAAGATTHAGLVEAVMNSDEFNLFVAPVSRLYLSALLRVPDAPGLDNWVNYAKANSLQTVADQFAASQEFTNRYAAMDDTAYVTALYENILGREPDPAGLADWVGRLGAGTATRSQILIGFAQSQEAIHLFAPTVRTFLHYFTFLGATPTPQDLDTWRNYLATLNDEMRQTFLSGI